MAPGPELYIYWKVPSALLEQALAAARSLQASLCAEDRGLQARLLLRADAAADEATVMEIYTRAAGVLRAQQQAIQERADRIFSAAGIPTPRRHLEEFVLPP